MRPASARGRSRAKTFASIGTAAPAGTATTARATISGVRAARAGAALAAFGLLTWAASLPPTRRIDTAVTLWLQRAAPAPDLPAALLATLGNAEVLLLGVALVGVLLLPRSRRAGLTALWLAAGLTAASLAVVSLKFLIVHPGPFGPLVRPGLGFGLRSPAPYSFPSGHTVRTTLIAGAVLRRWWWLAAMLVASMMTALVYLGYHWASDVLGGLCLGWALVEGWVMLTTVRSRSCRPD